MMWCVWKGDPHWDDNQIWTAFGHLYKGGMWFKKLAKIAADEGVTLEHMKVDHSEATSNGLPTSVPNYSINTTPLTNSEKQDYFFLPAMGYYDAAGTLYGLGTEGRYWSSMFWPVPSFAHGLQFDKYHATQLYYNRCNYGYMAAPFK